MGTIEYISSCVAIAGIAFIFTIWQPTQYQPLINAAHTQMLCPDLQIRHSVASNLKTGIRVVDACASNLNVVKY